MQRAMLLLVVVAFIPRPAAAQGEPVGPEFRVNTYTSFDQKYPAVASDASGNFVVVWSSPAQDGSSTGVFGQRYDSSGAPLGPEFRVNTYTTDAQGFPAVASDVSGNFVVVWISQDGSDYGVFGQRYASTGEPVGPEFGVNTYTTGWQAGSLGPAVASDASGNFVVVWQSLEQDGDTHGIFGQRYDSSGAPLGPEFRVNTYTTDAQRDPSVAADSSGDFVVVWSSFGQDGWGDGVFGQRYNSTGAPVGPEFRVNTYTTNDQQWADVTSDGSGKFVVVWSSDQDGSSAGVFGQLFASSGVPLGPAFRANRYTTDAQTLPSVSSDALGNFVVVWESWYQDGSRHGVFGQRCCASTGTLGLEFRVNTHTAGNQDFPDVASDSSGNFVVVWRNTSDVFGQRYNQIAPVRVNAHSGQNSASPVTTGKRRRRATRPE